MNSVLDIPELKAGGMKERNIKIVKNLGIKVFPRENTVVFHDFLFLRLNWLHFFEKLPY